MNAEIISKHSASGTHRSCAPAETLSRLEPLLSSFGITRVANLSGLDRLGLPVVAVFRPNARSSAVFHGKGTDIISAKVSGLMEAIETWHAENVGLPLMFGSVEELADLLMLANVAGLPGRPSATTFSSHTPLLWVEGKDVSTGGPAWVPLEVVHANFTLDAPPASGCFAMTTNGLASGNTVPEAISHGLCELIERDATALWRASPAFRQDEMRLDLSSVTDPLCRDVLDRFSRHALDVAVWDITTDVGVTAYQCLLKDGSGEAAHTGSGAGCHPSRGLALLRALTEAAQVRMTYIVGSREDIGPGDYTAATLRSRHGSTAVLIGRAAGTRRFEQGSDVTLDTGEAEVAWIVDGLQRAGLQQVIVVDLSQPRFGIPVVRVVVPCLEGSDHQFEHYEPGDRHRRLRRGH